MRRSRRDTQGTALLVSIGVLAVLAMLSISFARMTTIERQAARSYVHQVRAKHMAEWGLEMAIARLREQATERSYDRHDDAWRYGGEDIAPKGVLDLSKNVFEPGQGELNIGDCPLSLALAPSYAHADNVDRLSKGWPAISGYGRQDGMAETAYALKIIDCASQLDVNGGLSGSAAANDEYKLVLAAMINSLWGAIVLESSLGSEFDLALGTHLVTERPTSGFPNSLGLRRAVLSISADLTVAEEIWRRVAPFLTVHAWRDKSVVRPRPQRVGEEELKGIVRLTDLEREPRAPININTADWKVLYAVFNGLKGRYHRPGAFYHVDPETGLYDLSKKVAMSGESVYTEDRLYPVSIPATLAETLAKKLVERRKKFPFKSWESLETYLDTLKEAATLTQPQVDLILAQAIPDTLLNKLNPDFVVANSIDKTDLTGRRTELCFSSMGYFEVESLGMVTYKGYTLARSQVETVVKIFDVLRHTTYEEFETGELTPAGYTGESWLQIHPETSATRDVDVKPYDGRIGLGCVSSMAGDKNVTFGASLRVKSGSPPKGPGEKAEERDLDAKHEAEEDAEKAELEYFDDVTSKTMSKEEAERERDKIEARHERNERRRDREGQRVKNRYEGKLNKVSSGGIIDGPLVGKGPQGTRFGDGAYAEGIDKYPYWDVYKMLDPRRGAVSFWFKPNWDPTSTVQRPHSLLDMNGGDPRQTFQIYYDSRLADSTSDAGKANGLITFIAWDMGMDKKVRIDIPTRDLDGSVMAGAHYWINITVAWDVEGYKVTIKSKKKKGKFNKKKVSDEEKEALQAKEDAELEVLEDDLDDTQDAQDEKEEELEDLLDGGADPTSPAVKKLEAEIEALETKEKALKAEIKVVKEKYRKLLRGESSTDNSKSFKVSRGGEKTDPLKIDRTTRLRLGGPLRVWDPTKNSWSHSVYAPSDSTYADVFIYKLKQKDIARSDAEGSKAIKHIGEDMAETFETGRYYNGDAALGNQAYYTSAELTETKGHALGTITWHSLHPPDSGAFLQLEILTKVGGVWTPMEDLVFDRPGDNGLPKISGPIKYRARFIEDVESNDALLETPYLDSVTITILVPPQFLEWRWTI